MKTPAQLNIKKGTVIPPGEGWETETYYRVEAAFSSRNPVSQYLFYSGFLGAHMRPSGYNQIYLYETNAQISDTYYLKVLEKLDINLDPHSVFVSDGGETDK